MNALLAIPESIVAEEPRFFVEEPDGDKSRTEIKRVTVFRRDFRLLAPTLKLWANGNAGKRNPLQAMREGIKAGLFDYTVVGRAPDTWWLEFKGYDARGRAGSLSDAQILWGNDMHDRGFNVACFFSPVTALKWLSDRGAPMLGVPL